MINLEFLLLSFFYFTYRKKYTLFILLTKEVDEWNTEREYRPSSTNESTMYFEFLLILLDLFLQQNKIFMAYHQIKSPKFGIGKR